VPPKVFGPRNLIYIELGFSQVMVVLSKTTLGVSHRQRSLCIDIAGVSLANSDNCSKLVHLMNKKNLCIKKSSLDGGSPWCKHHRDRGYT
jgi:hypothetical protein